MFKQAGVGLTAGQTLDVKFALAVGSMQQTVEVFGQPAALSYESIDQHSVVDERGVSNLPLAKLDWTGLLVTTNGVSQGGNSGNSSVSDPADCPQRVSS